MDLTPTISFGMVVNWFVILGIGCVIFGLLKYAYKKDLSQMLTKEEHAQTCPKIISEVIKGRKEDIVEALALHRIWLDAKFETINERIEKTVMREIRALNSKKIS